MFILRLSIFSHEFFSLHCRVRRSPVQKRKVFLSCIQNTLGIVGFASMSLILHYVFRKLEHLYQSCDACHSSANGISLQLGSHHSRQVHCCQMAFKGELYFDSFQVYRIYCSCLDLGHSHQCMQLFQKGARYSNRIII